MTDREALASEPDIQAIRERAGAVMEAMSQDCGPTVAEPYSSWASQEARDILDLLFLIDTQAHVCM